MILIVATEEFYTENKGQNIKRYKEMAFHEQIFNHMCFDLENKKLNEEVPVEIAYSFLRVLLDPRKMSREEHVIMMKGNFFLNLSTNFYKIKNKF
jgi:hypothetical protein